MSSVNFKKITLSSNEDKGIVLIAASAISFGMLPILFSLMPFQNIGVAIQITTRLVICIASVLTWQLIHKRNSFYFLPPQASQRWFFVWNGFVILAAFTTYNLSIGLGTSPAKAVLLAYTSPIQTAILSSIFLKEEITLRKAIAILGGVTGMLISLGFWQAEDLLRFQLSDSLALLNGFFCALILIFARKSSSFEDLHPYISLRYTLTSALLWVMLLFAPLSFIFPGVRSIWTLTFERQTIFLLLGVGLLGTTLPYFFLYSGSRYLPATVSGLILLLEPVSVFALQALILNEPILWWQLMGGAILLLSGYLVREKEIKQVPSPEIRRI